MKQKVGAVGVGGGDRECLDRQGQWALAKRNKLPFRRTNAWISVVEAPDDLAWALPQSAHSSLQAVSIVARVEGRPWRRTLCKACLYEGRLRAQELAHFELEEHGLVPADAFQIVFCKGIGEIGRDRVRPIPEPFLQVVFLLIIHSGHELPTGVSSRVQLFARIHVGSGKDQGWHRSFWA
jgi:hypothetical protein